MYRLLFATAVAIAALLAAGCGSTTSTPKSAPAAQTQPAQSQQPAPVDTSPAAPQWSVAQQQAIESAATYLASGQGFSKQGLYQQLSSAAGEGFSKKLARFAVDHIVVNWRHQAVLSARSYMQTQPGWSYSSLVQQLDSPYGEGFTPAQAAYAAHKVGL